MIHRKLKFQMVFFCNGAVISPTPEIIQRLLALYMPKGFLPSHLQELDGSSMKPVQRLSLQSPAAGVMVNFLSNRIDILKQVGMPGAEDLGELQEFITESASLLSSISDEFKIKGNRLALLADYFLEPMSKERVERIRNKLLPSNFSPIEGDNFEWNYRVATKGQLGFGCEETINSITALNKIIAQIPEPDTLQTFDGIQLSVDINTVPENTDTRFDSNNLTIFFNSAKQAHDRTIQLVTESMHD